MASKYPDLAALRAGLELPRALAELDDPLLEEIPWVRSNQSHGHQITIRSPSRDFGLTTKPPSRILFSLAKVTTQEELIRQMFYGSTWDNPEESTGLSEYYSTTDPTRAQNATNVIDAGGLKLSRGLMTASIYLVCWSPRTVYVAWNTDSEGNLLACLVPEDWRYIVRVANIDVENCAIDLAETMQRATLFVPSAADKPVFYMGEKVASILRRQLQMPTLAKLMTVPIRELDALHCREERLGARAA